MEELKSPKVITIIGSGFTKDLTVFNNDELNRDINKKTVIALEKVISSNGFITPIVVDKHFCIIDGQHRLTACKNLGCGASFVQLDISIESDTIASVNSVGKHWVTDDHFENGLRRGIQGYAFVKKLLETGAIARVTLDGLPYVISNFTKGDIMAKRPITLDEELAIRELETYISLHKTISGLYGNKGRNQDLQRAYSHIRKLLASDYVPLASKEWDWDKVIKNLTPTRVDISPDSKHEFTKVLHLAFTHHRKMDFKGATKALIYTKD